MVKLSGELKGPDGKIPKGESTVILLLAYGWRAGNFELTNLDLAGAKNFTVLTDHPDGPS